MEDWPRISPKSVRYIKLGEGGAWEKGCIEQGLLQFGTDSGSPETLQWAAEGRWSEFAASWRAVRSQGTSTRFTNETRFYFEAGPEDLWITFVGERFYWGFLEPGVPKPMQPDLSSVRTVRDGWRCVDREGKPLLKSNLPGSITSLAAYRGTSCSVKAAAHVVRRINAELSEEVKHAEIVRSELIHSLVPLIRRLGPRDFEVLVELIFGASGWRRIDSTGGTRKLLDLDLELPSTGERAFVQVKARTSQAEFEAYAQQGKDGVFSRMFYVYHTGAVTTDDEAITVIEATRLARMTLDAGLTDWVIRKAE
ncbi:restriction endonuclease [Lysobacter capsici]|uniref:restriction endonuclease n=1 Tax=Lysobacter capsici TaxID=435897 RepID=UPI000A8909BA|nr:restriction endonuclease [Lysobacter capsici]